MESLEGDFNRKAASRQEDEHLIVPIGTAAAPKTIGRLLTIRQACDEFPGVHRKLLYALVEAGIITALQVRPHGRIYYSERELKRWWEDVQPLRETGVLSRFTVTRLYRTGSDFGTRAA